MSLGKAVSGLTNPYQCQKAGLRFDLNTAKDNVSHFTQRVMSAKLLRLKQLENQLAEAHLQINELGTENRLLRALQKRQDLALDRYEGTHAQLPQLVRSHHEEVRVLRVKYKNLKTQLRGTTKTLRERETELQNLKEQHAHLLKLSRDRHLGEREVLSKQVDELKSTVANQTSTIQTLNRKILLETKNLKYQLQQEMQRHKATQSHLQDTMIKMEQLQLQSDQAKERLPIPPMAKRQGRTIPLSRISCPRKEVGDVEAEHSRPSWPKTDNYRYMADQVTPSIPLNNDPSSDQPDSTNATYSDKTNGYSTSMDSSPDHFTDGQTTSDSVGTGFLPSHQLLQHPCRINSSSRGKLDDKLSKSNSLLNYSFEKNKKNNFGQEEHLLETEYKRAAELLAEISLTEDEFIESSSFTKTLESVGLPLSRHEAALGNASLAMKGAVLPPPDCSVIGDKHAAYETEKSCALKKEGSAMKNDYETSGNRENCDSHVSETQLYPPKTESKISDGKLLRRHSNENSDTSLKPASSNAGTLHESWVKLNHKFEHEDQQCMKVMHPFRSTLRELKEDEAESTENANVENEAFHKDALLKALKAIDDDVAGYDSEGNKSDSSDLDVTKEPFVCDEPEKVFLSANLLRVGMNQNIRFPIKRKPFK